MEKVVIPKWLGEEVTKFRKSNDFEGLNHYKRIYRFMECKLTQEENEVIAERYNGFELLRILNGEYEVEKEYLTLAQVMELPNETIVTHEKIPHFFIVRNHGDLTCLKYVYKDESRVFTKSMLEPTWYIAEENNERN